MLKKMRGFTLIELLIVVAIIGILAALLIPNALEAMKAIMTVSTAAVDYITDHGDWTGVTQAGDLTTNAGLTAAIASFYIKVIPVNDPWNTPFRAYVGTFGVGLVTQGVGFGTDDFAMASLGRDKALGPISGANYSPTNPEAGMYIVTGMASFDNDLAAWNGSWVCAPRTNVGT